MADSRASYTGNGTTRQFNVPFPFIDRSHVQVKVNGGLQIAGVDFDWVGATTFQLRLTPVSGALIEVYRETPISTRLVDFQNGAVLTQEELDLNTSQLLYLIQEVKDYYEDKLNAELVRIGNGTGVTNSTPSQIIAGITQQVLAGPLLADLQARITDINANAESIIQQATRITNVESVLDGLTDPNGTGGIVTLIQNETTARIQGDNALASDLALIGARSGDNLAWVLDLNKVRVGPTESLATRLSSLAATDASNASAIINEQTTRANAISAEASARTALAAVVNTKARVFRQSTQPAATAVGDVWYHTGDNNRPRVWDGSAWQLTDDARIAANTAAINSESTARANGDSALASQITTLTTTVNGNTASIQTQATAINGLSAQYTVKVDNNGRVAGFGLASTPINGTPFSSFVVLADRFAVVNPAAPGGTPVVPFVVQGGVVYIQDVVVRNAWIENLTITKLTTGSLNADMNMGTGRIIFDNGAFLMAQGVGFGTSNQFVLWFGPRPAGGNLNLCAELGARFYLKTNGQAYFGGSIAAGTLTTSGQSGNLASNADVVVQGTSNGGIITVAYSYSWFASRTIPVNGSSTLFNTPPTATVVFSRAIGTAGFVDIATQNVSGSVTIVNPNTIDAIPGEETEQMAGSWTFTDTAQTAQNRQYRLRITARSVQATGAQYAPGQNLSIVASE